MRISREVAAGSGKARHQTVLDRIDVGSDHDGYGGRQTLGFERHAVSRSYDHVAVEVNQSPDDLGVAFVQPLGRPPLEDQVLALDPSEGA